MRHKNYSGFTLIETILALAIGGLILGMVFIAVPEISANQRDSQRRDDMLLFVNRLEKFRSSNNRGALPSGDPATGGVIDIDGSSIAFGVTSDTTWRGFYASFFTDSFVDPKTGKVYNLAIADCGVKKAGDCTYHVTSNFEANNSTIHIVRSAKCGEGKAIYSANARNVAVLYVLERAEIVYCVNNF